MKPIHNLIRDTGDLVRISGSAYKTLVENSKDYDGDDYPRKVISEMIRLAEENLNIPHTQLLSKWDLYLVEIHESLVEDAGKELTTEVKQWLDDKTSEGIILSLGWFDEAVRDKDNYRPILEGVSWQEQDGDLDDQNAFGVEATWGEDVVEEIVSNGKATMLVHLDESAGVSNAKTLVAAAKEADIKISNGAQLALYRAYNFADAFGDLVDVTIIVHGTAEFFGSAANKSLLTEVLSWLKVQDGSFHAHATEFNKNGYFGGDELMLKLNLTSDGSHYKQVEVSKLDGTDIKLYYSEDARELDHIQLKYAEMEEDLESVLVPSLDANGKVGIKTPISTGGRALGFLSVNGVESIEGLPRHGAKNIPILEENLRDIIVYFGLSQTLERPQDNGLGLPRVLTGKPEYVKVLANCFPIFLYGPGSNRVDHGTLNEGGERLRLRNELYIEHTLLYSLATELQPYMDFEASNFYNEMVALESEEMKTIKDYLIEDPEFEEGYLKMYDRLANHIRKSYDHFVL